MSALSRRPQPAPTGHYAGDISPAAGSLESAFLTLDAIAIALSLRLERLLWKMELARAAPALIAALTSSPNSCIVQDIFTQMRCSGRARCAASKRNGMYREAHVQAAPAPESWRVDGPPLLRADGHQRLQPTS